MTQPTTGAAHIALKEWGLIDRWLRQGRQSVLVRTGGILEQRAGFRATHHRFLLYPTRFHQGLDQLRPAVRQALAGDPDVPAEPTRQPPGMELSIRTYVEVDRVYRVTDPGALPFLVDHQVLALPTLEQRFAYRDRPELHVLLVRAFALPHPFPVPNLERYGGCKSWVKLDRDVPVWNAVPAMDDAAYAAATAPLRERLSAFAEDGPGGAAADSDP